MTRLFRHVNHKGDTIVEVLLAMAIVSMVLAGAYVSSRRSSQSVRTAQERGEALKLAESQVEQIKIAVDNSTVLTPPFCFDISGAPQPGGSAACQFTNGITYTTAITAPTASNYVVKVTWPSLSTGTNSVELDYKAQ